MDLSRCQKPKANEPHVYGSDFKWGLSLSEMKGLYESIYDSGKRLKGRAYFDKQENSFVFEKTDNRSTVHFDETFIRSVTRHVEIALERRYADFVFFPDMGHSHFHIPEKEWDKATSGEMGTVYEKMLHLRTLKILYHTAEQLKIRAGDRGNGAFPQDEELLWRYFSRNPVGDNNGGENVAPWFAFQESYNTVKNIPGYKEWSAGFDISASKDGCFPFQYKGKTYYFDLSLESLPYAPADANHDSDEY